MESSSRLSNMPQRKALYPWQERIRLRAADMRTGLLTIKIPTGAGKTLAAVSAYAELSRLGEVNRLLYIVPTDAQREQFIQDGKRDFEDVGLLGIEPFDIARSPTLALKEHRTGKSQVFCTTIQAIANGNIYQTVKDLLQTSRWMIVVDEYHHYGIDKRWGKTILDLNGQFVLAMSATPARRNNDSAFGSPVISVTYREALEARAVKRLLLHAYEYRVDAITYNGDVISFTTHDIAEQAGSLDPEAIERFRASKRLRWSPKYISPLVSIPIERLMTMRLNTQMPLQVIVGALCCSHAQMVCEQIKAMFGDVLRIDWVGTGPHGRSREENVTILRRFCPPKRADGRRHPEDIELDVLVHVGMAGEGLDSIFVTEVVHINPANICNQNDQENGRGARRMPGVADKYQVCHINVDSTSEYAQYTGARIMDVFDAATDDEPRELTDEEQRELQQSEDYEELPNEFSIVIADVELLHIDKGDPEVMVWVESLAKALPGLDTREFFANLTEDHPVWDRAIELRRKELLERASGMNRMSRLAQMRSQLDTHVKKLTGLVVRILAQGGRFEKSLPGDIKRRINSRKKLLVNNIEVGDLDEEQLEFQRQWLKALEQEILREGLPAWLKL